MPNVNYSQEDICNHLKDGTGSRTGEEGEKKFSVNGLPMQGFSDGQVEAIIKAVNVQKSTAQSNLLKDDAARLARNAKFQAEIDECNTALEAIT